MNDAIKRLEKLRGMASRILDEILAAIAEHEESRPQQPIRIPEGRIAGEVDNPATMTITNPVREWVDDAGDRWRWDGESMMLYLLSVNRWMTYRVSPRRLDEGFFGAREVHHGTTIPLKS